MGEERAIPTPPRRRGREIQILQEVPGVLGMILWQELRHLHAWADPAVQDRAALFHAPMSTRALALRREARAGAGEIAPALLTFQGVVTSPMEADHAQVARACSSVVAWAVERDHVETAI